jgi:hypothetical protein
MGRNCGRRGEFRGVVGLVETGSFAGKVGKTGSTREEFAGLVQSGGRKELGGAGV